MSVNQTQPVATPWRKSSYSGPNGGECVEVACTPNKTGVRDSKNPDGPNLAFPAAAWHRFLSTLR